MICVQALGLNLEFTQNSTVLCKAILFWRYLYGGSDFISQNLIRILNIFYSYFKPGHSVYHIWYEFVSFNQCFRIGLFSLFYFFTKWSPRMKHFLPLGNMGHNSNMTTWSEWDNISVRCYVSFVQRVCINNEFQRNGHIKLLLNLVSVTFI